MILVFGANGQVGRHLARMDGTRALSRDEADLSDPGACARAIRDARPDAVINAAAYTAVDKAEEDEARATTVNGDSPGAMARAAADLGVPIVQISTDYVFQGTGTAPYCTNDATAPLGAYGRSKLAGEKAVRAAGGTHAILRTSWVFAGHGANFVRTMLRLSQTRDRLAIVADQVGGPTPAQAIAEATLAMAHRLIAAPNASGTYHFSGAPDVSWADFARAIFAEAGRAVTVEDIPGASYPTPAARPANSRLDCSDTEAAFGLTRPDWRAALGPVIREIEATP